MRNLLPLLIALAYLLVAPAHAAGKAKKPPLSFDAALALLHDDKAMTKSVAKRRATADAFANLDAEQKPAALAKLLPLVGKLPNRFAKAVLRDCFMRLGATAIEPLGKLLVQDEQWDGASQILPFFKEAALPPALQLLGHSDPTLRRRGLTVLARFAGAPGRMGRSNKMQSVTPIVAKLLADKDPAVASGAARVLALMGPSAADATPALAQALASPNAELRLATARALAQVGAGAAAATPALVQALADDDDATRQATVRALGALGENGIAALAPLGKLLNDARNTPTARADAAAAIGKIGGKQTEEAIALLAQAFDGDVPALRLHAARAAAALGEAGLPAIVAGLDSASARQRRFFAFALALMGPDANSASGRLRQALKDKNALVRRNAAEALGRIGEEQAVAALEPLLADADLGAALAAARALSALGVPASLAQRLDKLNTSTADPSHGAEGKPEDYLIGGPLAGVALPLFPTQHGAPPGHPGSIEKLSRKAMAATLAEKPDVKFDALNTPFSPVGQHPELELYAGAAEHWRAYMFKYMPVRSSFDRQSQLKNWVAPKIPGAAASQVAKYAAPIWWTPRWGKQRPTGLKREPVPVVRWGLKSPPIALDLGKLPRGAYVVRIVAAVPTEEIRGFRRPLFIRMQVNDGLAGESSTYLKRATYTDELYSMCELFFHAPANREYRAELTVAEGSEVTLLVHNISLDDALAGTTRRAVKTRATMVPERAAAVLAKSAKKRQPLAVLSEDRELRDAWLWDSFPPPNRQGNRPYRLPGSLRQGTLTEDGKQLAAKHGSWGHGVFRRGFNRTPVDPQIWLTNAKLGLTYSLEDRRQYRPLPDPYPFKDNGAGVTFANPENPAGGAYWTPIANVMTNFYWHYPTAIHGSVGLWEKTGNEAYAHDAALALARWAYAFPTLYTQSAYLHNTMAEYGQVGRNARFRKRMTTSQFYRWYTQYASEELDDYDLLFGYIKDNWELARSVGRRVPWVKTPRDVIKLIDTYLVQPTAKRVLRYQWHTGEMKVARLASVLGDNSVSDPWMEWLFSGTFIYPLPVAGLGDLMVTGCTREGTEYVASTFYAAGENALPKAAALQSYLKVGGNPRFDLSDPVRYPKPIATCYWLVERFLAGLHYPRVGDVTGPDKSYGQGFNALDTASYWGWKWTRDPRFAFLRHHYFEQKDFTDAEWREIGVAAAKVKRAPWLAQPSRVLPQWATILEAGKQHDDFRFRRAVALRQGMGWGHHHNDGLDLQLYAHGAMMTCDGGQRPTYSRPPDRSTRMHNLVEVDGLDAGGGEWLGHNWTRTLADATGAIYTRCQAVPPDSHPNVKLYQRQTALLDVDEGQGSKPLTPAQCLPKAKLDLNVTTANSYVFDVFRVSGGKRHTYAFHANLSDEVQHNIVDPVAIAEAPEKDKAYVGRLAGERLAGQAPEHLQVTWQIAERQVRRDLQGSFNIDAPRYFTRLHMLGEAGARVLRGSLDCVKWGYQIPMAFVQRRGPDEDKPEAAGSLESAFAAVLEPYVGKPFIAGIERRQVAGNETDAQRAVALEVKTVSGHTDLCFADGRPERTRTVGAATISGEHAYLSVDGEGLRQASLTGGTLLRTADVILAPAAREHTGTVAKVDYGKKTLWVDQRWDIPAARPGVFETGMDSHWTAYTGVEFQAGRGKTTAIRVQRGADYYLSRVKDIDAKTNTVYCGLGFGSGREGGDPSPGMIKHWAASDEEGVKFWRAEYLGGDRSTNRYGFKLTGSPAKMADFGRTKGFRLWEYGVGDTVRHSTFASLRRVGANVFELTANVEISVALKGAKLEISLDGQRWKGLRQQKVSGVQGAKIAVKQLGPDGKAFVRIAD